MVNDHSNSERGNPLPPHGLFFPITAMVLLYPPSHRRIAHTTAFDTPVVEHWQEREIAQWVHPMKNYEYKMAKLYIYAVVNNCSTKIY